MNFLREKATKIKLQNRIAIGFLAQLKLPFSQNNKMITNKIYRVILSIK
jgi:hypothetical protein